MKSSWQFARIVVLATTASLWENRSYLWVSCLAIGMVDYLSLIDSLASIKPLLQLLSLVLVVTLGVLIHRGLLLNDYRLNLNWGMREVRYLLVLLGVATLGFLVFALLQYLSLYAIAGVVLPAEYPLPDGLKLSEYEAPEEVKNRLFYVVIVSSIFGLAGFAYIFSRLCFLLPAIATDQLMTIVDAWAETSEHQLSMFVIIFTPILLLLPVSYGYQYSGLVPVLLLAEFIILSFIFSSMTISFHMLESDPVE